MKLEKYGNVVDSQIEKNHIHYINFKYFAIFSVNCVNGFDISKGCSLILKNIQTSATIDKVHEKKDIFSAIFSALVCLSHKINVNYLPWHVLFS